MMTESKDVFVAGREFPKNGEALDQSIARLLGLRAEMQDGIMKVWAWDVAPDESNWTTGVRYTQSPETTAELLAERGVQHIIRQDGDYVFCVFGADEWLAETPLFEDEDDALAAALWIALVTQSRVT